jgi:hypothetical protein
MQSRRGRKVGVILQADHFGRRDKNAMFIYPIQDLVEVSALVRNIEVRERIIASHHPVVSDHCPVTTTHNILPEHFDTVI